MTCHQVTGSGMVRHDVHSKFCECLLVCSKVIKGAGAYGYTVGPRFNGQKISVLKEKF
jgi:hypothetical protein